jgi:hypothetical protein
VELFTMDRQYDKQTVIDFFSSAIWTERVGGDDDCQISVPATKDNIITLGVGTFIGEVDSDVPMMLDDQTIEDGVLTVTGTSLTQHLNDRFIRFDPYHESKSYPITGSPGYILQYLVQNMAIDGDWLEGVQNMGIPNPSRLKIPYFTIGDWYNDPSLSVTIQVQYGPLYDQLKDIADTYLLGIKIARFGVNDIRFRVYLGADHSTGNLNELVRFSPDLDNFGGTKEVLSAKSFKTHAFTFPSGTVEAVGITDTSGEDSVVGSYVGFDLRAMLVFADDITNYTDAQLAVLQQRSQQALTQNQMVGAVDGQIAPSAQYIYGTHYKLGDIVETQGASGIIQRSRVTEYIRAQDNTGEKAYPTLVAVT